MMNLTDYLKSTGERPYKFADRVPVSRPLVYQILKLEKGQGTRRVSLELSLKIRAASDGAISLELLGVAP